MTDQPDLDAIVAAARANESADSYLWCDLEAAIVALADQRDELEMWGSNRSQWAEKVIEALGDRHDDEACDCASDLADEVVAALATERQRVAALEKLGKQMAGSPSWGTESAMGRRILAALQQEPDQVEKGSDNDSTSQAADARPR